MYNILISPGEVSGKYETHIIAFVPGELFQRYYNTIKCIKLS